MVGTGATFTPPDTDPGFYEYSASCTCGSCESPIGATSLTIFPDFEITVNEKSCDASIEGLDLLLRLPIREMI